MRRTSSPRKFAFSCFISFNASCCRRVSFLSVCILRSTSAVASAAACAQRRSISLRRVYHDVTYSTDTSACTGK